MNVSRWTQVSADVIGVAPLTYRAFEKPPPAHSTTAGATLAQARARTPREKYRHALAATQVISSELADIEDDEEFDYLLDFVLTQWRNVRLRRYLRPVDRSAAADCAAEPSSQHSLLSQPHSLWSEELGEIATSDTSRIIIDEPMSLRVAESQHDDQPSEPSDLAPEKSFEPESEPEPKQNIEPSQPETESMPTITVRTTLVPISKITFDDAVIKIEPGTQPVTRTKTKPKSTQPVTRAKTKPKSTQPVTRAKTKTKKPTPDDDDFESEDEETVGKKRMRIKMNPKAKKTGRPQKSAKKTISAERVDRSRFNASEYHRRSLGVVTLEQLLENLEKEKPPPTDVLNRLDPIEEKYAEHTTKKPKYQRLKAPILNEDPFYLLPEKLLNTCMNALPLSNGPDDAIVIGSQSQSSQEVATSTGSNDAKDVEVVSIAGVGKFSRATIEAMQRVVNLRKACNQCVEMYSWLTSDVMHVVSAAEQNEVKEIADHVGSKYPTCIIQGLSNDPHYQTLYRVTPPQWFNDGLIEAFCERLQQLHPQVRCPGIPEAKSITKAMRRAAQGRSVAEALRDRIAGQCAEPGVDVLLLPVNFGNQHWCGIIIDRPKRTINYYDSMNHTRFLSTLEDISQAVVTHVEALAQFDIVSLNSPIQFDSFSCGFFVCAKFWRHIDKTVPSPTTERELTRLRYKLLKFVLTQEVIQI